MQPRRHPKSIRNRCKLDAKRLSILDFDFKLMFDRLWLPIRTLRTVNKYLSFLEKLKFVLKIRFSQITSMFNGFRCQHGSFLVPKNLPNLSKNRSQDASIFRSIFASFFLRFCFDFGSQLGAMLATFSLKIRRPNLTEGSFMLDLSFFSVFWASWPPLGALWARFGRVRASILEVFGAHFLHNFQVFCTHFFSNLSPMLKHLLHYNLVCDGLVGLREAQRIQLYMHFLPTAFAAHVFSNCFRKDRSEVNVL